MEPEHHNNALTAETGRRGGLKRAERQSGDTYVVEFMPYWAGEIEKVIAEPGCGFGRTPEHVGRLQGISEHEMDSLSRIKAALPRSYARLNEVLGRLKESDLELTGKHVRYGEKPLDWLIEEVVTHHLSGHVEQIKRCLEVIG